MITIVGSGNVGTALKKHFLTQKKKVSLEIFPFQNDVQPGFLFLAVPDNVVEEILHFYKKVPEELTIIHFSGAISIPKEGVFQLHPYASITRETVFSDILCTMWGRKDEKIIEALKKMKFSFSYAGKAPEISYHTSAVIAGNFTQILYLSAKKLLVQSGVEKSVVDKLLEQLIQTSIKNVIQQGASGLTGPAVRKDRKTIYEEEQCLSNNKEMKETYTQLTKLIEKELEENDLFEK